MKPISKGVINANKKKAPDRAPHCRAEYFGIRDYPIRYPNYNGRNWLYAQQLFTRLCSIFGVLGIFGRNLATMAQSQAAWHLTRLNAHSGLYRHGTMVCHTFNQCPDSRLYSTFSEYGHNSLADTYADRCDGEGGSR